MGVMFRGYVVAVFADGIDVMSVLIAARPDLFWRIGRIMAEAFKLNI